MNINLTPSTINGTVFAPPSKSYAHRYIICAFLSNSETVIKNVGSSSDVLETISALKAVGANITLKGDDCCVLPCTLKKTAMVKIKESASTFRFLLPVFCALKIKVQFILGKQLARRPNEFLISLLNSNGADIENYQINGELKNGTYFLDTSVSSQFVSGLLIALSLLKEKSQIIFTKKLSSKYYVDMTIDVLNKFSVFPDKKENVFSVFPSKFISKNEIVNEGDFSSTANVLAMGAIGGKISVCGLNENSLQGDRKIIEILKSFGASVSFNCGVLTVEKNNLSGIEIDVDNIIDLAPVIATLGAFASGKTILKSVNRLKFKESNRLKAIIDFLEKAKIKTEIHDNQLIVYGGNPQGAIFNSFFDHRIEMAEVVLSTFAVGKSKIENAFNQKKSYTNFYEDYISLGGKTDVGL